MFKKREKTRNKTFLYTDCGIIWELLNCLCVLTRSWLQFSQQLWIFLVEKNVVWPFLKKHRINVCYVSSVSLFFPLKNYRAIPETTLGQPSLWLFHTSLFLSLSYIWRHFFIYFLMPNLKLNFAFRFFLTQQKTLCLCWIILSLKQTVFCLFQLQFVSI